jgi:RHS repeat-associated protein
MQHNYTARGDLQSVQDVSGQHVYWTAQQRNASGQLVRERLGNNLTTTRGYDDTRGWLRTIDTQTAAGTPVQALEYEYESNGNLHQRNDHLSYAMEEFSYDFLNRLTEWDISQHIGKTTTNYGYNDMGNLMSRTVTGSSKSSEIYTYGSGQAGSHALTQVTSGSAKMTYTYDTDGNQKTGPGRTANYTMFNLPSRLWGGSADISFKYDAMHNRVLKKQTNGNAIVYVANLYEKRTAAGTTNHVFYIQAEDRIVAQILWTQKGSSFGADKILYLHDDHLGSIETITDASGKVVDHLKYDPFGARRNSQNLATPISQSPVDVHRGFTDQEHDDEFSLINMHGRMYDATMGRFLSADPLVGDPFFSQSYNRYSYVLNNPLSFTDPTGFQSSPSGSGTEPSSDVSSYHSFDPVEITGDPGRPPPPPPPPPVADDQGSHDSHTSQGPDSLQSTGDRNKSNSTPEAEQQAAKVRFNTWTKILGPSSSPLQRIAASPNTPEFQRIETSRLPIDVATYATYISLGTFVVIELGVGAVIAEASAAIDKASIWLAARLVVRFPRIAAVLGLASWPRQQASTEINTKVTENVVREAMKDASLKTQQKAVSLPRIQEYVMRLEEGEIPPPIKVDSGIIVDGNHRYIAGKIFGQEPLQTPWAGGNPSNVVEWTFGDSTKASAPPTSIRTTTIGTGTISRRMATASTSSGK